MDSEVNNQASGDLFVNVATRPSEIAQATGTDNDALAMLMINQVLQACQDKNYNQADLTTAVMELLTELKPRTAMEGMLVSQMVVSSLNSMRLMKQAMAGYSSGPCPATINLSIKLQRLFLDQIKILEILRGNKSHQKISVEHIHINDGAQAVIGQVRHEGSKAGGDT